MSLTASLARFVGSPAYGPAALRDDFARFRFLLGATDGGIVSAQDDLLNGSAARREFGVARQAIMNRSALLQSSWSRRRGTRARTLWRISAIER